MSTPKHVEPTDGPAPFKWRRDGLGWITGVVRRFLTRKP